MYRFRLTMFFLAVVVAFVGLYFLRARRDQIMTPYKTEIVEFRKKAEERLRAPDGWLSVVGLFWLKEGANTVGSSEASTVRLPEAAPAQLGEITLTSDRQARIRFTTTATLNGQPTETAKTYPLVDDAKGDATAVQTGSVTFFLIQRKNGVGVRVRDSEALTRKNFSGRQWYEIDENLRLDAEWVAHTQPRSMIVPDILGNMNEEKSPGFARFQLNGKNFELHPTQSGEDLFFVFRDASSQKDSYGAARFLYASAPAQGRVTLDFNRAVNPPCAFTAHATCPMPPAENILNVVIAAGEKKPLNAVADH